MKGSTRRLFAAATVLAACLTAVLSGRQAPAPAAPMAEQVFKNVQVLKGIPVDEFMLTMGFYATATGLNCTDCHVEESGGSWARYADDNALKRQARRMQVMMNTINRTNFGGRQVVTCVTCHRGVSRPTVMPSLDLLYSELPPEEPGDIIAPAPRQPSADQIFDRHIAAAGGDARLSAVTAIAGTGTFVGFDDAEKTPFELAARAPGQRRTIVRGRSGDTITTVDGRSAWMAAPLSDRPVALTEITGQELEGLLVESRVLFPSQMKQALTTWRVGFPTVIGDRDVHVVQGTTAGGAVVTLCFDQETGLLTRFIRFAASPVGRVVTRVDYADYRDVDGMKFPFAWTVAWLGGRSIYQLTSLDPNANVPASTFTR